MKKTEGRKSCDTVSLIEDLREFESICKTVLAHESGDPGVQFNEKTEGRKSRDTVSLNKEYCILSGVKSFRVYIPRYISEFLIKVAHIAFYKQNTREKLNPGNLEMVGFLLFKTPSKYAMEDWPMHTAQINNQWQERLDRSANLGPFGQQEKVMTTTPNWEIVAQMLYKRELKGECHEMVVEVRQGLGVVV
jgi:hypothetical protein